MMDKNHTSMFILHSLGKETTEFTSNLTLGKESSYNGQRFAILIHLLGKEFISMVNYQIFMSPP